MLLIVKRKFMIKSKLNNHSGTSDYLDELCILELLI